jgi:hypothetical protein
MIESNARKPLWRKAYGSIGHLPQSRMGPGDHAVSPGMARICCEKARDKHDRIIVQEKLDGSCCAVALIDGVLHPLGRAGYPAESSRWVQHRHFANWARMNEDRVRSVLTDGERLVGEWLAQAHGTRYDLTHDPFVAFDIMTEDRRIPFEEFERRVGHAFVTPLAFAGPMDTENALWHVQVRNIHGALDPIEGVVYRVERSGKVDFLAKYVRPDKIDGCYLPEMSGAAEVWNWTPPAASPADTEERE